MNLTPWLNRVKSNATLVTAIIASAWLAAMGLAVISRLSDDTNERATDLGNALTSALAGLVAEPLVRQDRIELGMLSNRLAIVPGVTGVAVYTLDNQVLASTFGTTQGNTQAQTQANPAGRSFTEAVILQDSTIGYVKLYIDDTLFENGMGWGQWFLSLLWLCAIPVGVFWAGQYYKEAGGLLPALHALRHELRSRVVDVSLAPPPSDGFVVVANLHNQLSMSAEERADEVRAAMDEAESVAALYGGTVVTLSGRGFCLHFPEHDLPQSDRAFDVVCAAFVLAGVLTEIERRGIFRFGAHVFSNDDTAANETDQKSFSSTLNQSAQVIDAALLAACAADNQLAVSGNFIAATEHDDGIIQQPLVHPLRDDLATVSSGCYLISTLSPRYQQLVDGQIASLLGHSTDKASTF